MSVLRCRTCGSGVLVRDGESQPDTCNNCNPAVRRLIAEAAELKETLTPAENDEVERRHVDGRAYVVLIPVEGEPRLEAAPESGLELRWLQRMVGGYLEELRSPRLVGTRTVILVNEEGRRMALPRNPVASAVYVGDIVGPAVLVGVGRPPLGPDLLPLTHEAAEALRLVAILAGETA
ncbi:MAG: DUF3846 domain-containing protein [Chloroflexi bacterium]|nr:MAG: DUF3846 domain-containing protein [Chloroflexota bacterium]